MLEWSRWCTLVSCNTPPINGFKIPIVRFIWERLAERIGAKGRIFFLEGDESGFVGEAGQVGEKHVR